VVNLNFLAKGSVKNAIAAATAATTSSIALKDDGHNAILIYFDITGTGTWTVKIQGAISQNGTYMDFYDQNGNLMSASTLTADRCQLFIGLPTWFKIVATEDVDGATCKVDYQLLTV